MAKSERTSKISRDDKSSGASKNSSKSKDSKDSSTKRDSSKSNSAAKDTVESLLTRIATAMGFPKAKVKPLITKLEDEWITTVEDLRGT